MTPVAESANTIINRVLEGEDPSKVVAESLNEGISGPDRSDIDLPQKEAMFSELIAQSEQQVPYLNHDYVEQVLMQLRQGAPAQELIALAAKNRDDAMQSGANIGDPNFASWDAIHRSLSMTFTDELPPTQA